MNERYSLTVGFHTAITNFPNSASLWVWVQMHLKTLSPPVSVRTSTDDLGHLIHHVQGRLLQRCSCRSIAVWTGPGEVCHQRGCSAYGRCPQIRPCDTLQLLTDLHWLRVP